RRTRLGERKVLGEVEDIGEGERRPGVVRLDGITALSVEIEAESDLMVAADPRHAVMPDEIVMLPVVIAALAERGGDPGNAGVRESFPAHRRRSRSARAHHRHRSLVQQARREGVGPTESSESAGARSDVAQELARAGVLAFGSRAEPTEINSVLVFAQILV